MTDATPVKRFGVAMVTAALLMAASSGAAAQTPARAFEAGGELDTLQLSESRTTAIGMGATAKWNVMQGLAIDGLVSFFPVSWQTTPPTRVPSQGLVLALAGVRPGVTVGRVNLSARARAGVLDFREQDQPFPCVRILPGAARMPAPRGIHRNGVRAGGEVDVALNGIGPPPPARRRERPDGAIWAASHSSQPLDHRRLHQPQSPDLRPAWDGDSRRRRGPGSGVTHSP